MIRVYLIPVEIQDFPSDDIGENGDVAVNVLTSETKVKTDGAWVSQVQPETPLIETDPESAAQDLGIFTFDDIPGLEIFTYNGTTNIAGFDIEGQTDLVEASFPNMTETEGTLEIDGTNLNLETISAPVLVSIGGQLRISHNPSLTTIDFPLLETVGSSTSFSGDTSLVSLNLPSLTSFGSQVNGSDCTNLTTVSFPNLIFSNLGNGEFSGCALAAASVNHILARAVASSGFVAGVIDLSGGTSAAPTGQGIADKSTLQGRGVTVNTN